MPTSAPTRVRPLTAPRPTTDPVEPEQRLTDAELRRTLAQANGFLLEALPANRAGRLTTEQLQQLRLLRADPSASRAPRVTTRASLVGILVLLVGLGLLVLGRTGPAALIGWAGIVGGVLLIRASFPGTPGKMSVEPPTVKLDLAPRRVAVIETVVYKGMFRGGTPRRAGESRIQPTNQYFYLIDGEAVPVSADGYAALVAGRRYRLYCVPQTRSLCPLVNIEPSDLTPPAKRPTRPLWSRLVGRWRLAGVRRRAGHSAIIGNAGQLREWEFRPDGTVTIAGEVGGGPPVSARYLLLDETHLRLDVDLRAQDFMIDLRHDRLILTKDGVALDFERIS